MRILNFIVLCLFTLLTLVSKSQRANNWIFGVNAGLSFNTSTPNALSGGQTTGPDNTSAISDTNGNLLFYTDGVTVWNKFNSSMPNGTGLIGHVSAGQCALIVPMPCSADKYIIFHVTEFSNPGYLKYTVVDMSLNNGLGDVVSAQKNVSLGSGWTEKLCAYYEPVGNKYWVLTHKWNTDQFVAFEVNSSSIATNSVISSVGSVHNCGTYGSVHDAMGQLTISPDGTKVLNALTCQDKFELFNFNSATGQVSGLISIAGTGGSAWATAFSPDSKKIYMDAIFGTSILQYDISNYNQASILSTAFTVTNVASSGYNFGYMELGPDGKIYVAKPGASAMSVIGSPNIWGSGCNFAITGPSLGSSVSSHGTSRIAYNIPVNNVTSVISVATSQTNMINCSGSAMTLSANGASSYFWSTGATGTSIVVSPTIATTYIVSGSGSCGSSTAAIMVTVSPMPIINLTGPDKTICKGELVTLQASGATTYSWNNGSTSSITTFTPSGSGTYSVTGTNTLGCSSSATFSVSVNPCSGLSEGGESSDLFIYPSPFKNVLTLEVADLAKLNKVFVLNSRGVLVKSFGKGDLNFVGKVLAMDLSSLPAGIYFISVEGQLLSGKPIKVIKE